MQKVINVNLDIKRATAQQNRLPALVVGDTGNKIIISMFDEGVALDLSSVTKIVAAFSKVSDGSISEQDTEDAIVSLPTIGVDLAGEPVDGDTITVMWTSSEITTTVTCTGSLSATLDREKFGAAYPTYGEYVFTYHAGIFAWQRGDNSVTFNNNVVTIDPVRNGSYGVGKNNVELQIYEGEELITSAQFNFDGRPGIVNDETIQSEDKFPLLVALLRRVEAAESSNGDMRKSVYDPDDDGKVSDADHADHANNADHASDADHAVSADNATNGVSAGGTAGQAYVKASGDDYDGEWGSLTPGMCGAAPAKHASQHASGGSDAITPANIGAVAASTFNSHKARHKTGGADALTAADIGAMSTTVSSGTGTRNTTNTTSSGFTVTYKKIGRICWATFSFTTASSVTGTYADYTIATGLAKALDSGKYLSTIMSDSGGNPVSMSVNTAGSLIMKTRNVDVHGKNYYGSVCYITES